MYKWVDESLDELKKVVTDGKDKGSYKRTFDTRWNLWKLRGRFLLKFAGEVDRCCIGGKVTLGANTEVNIPTPVPALSIVATMGANGGADVKWCNRGENKDEWEGEGTVTGYVKGAGRVGGEMDAGVKVALYAEGGVYVGFTLTIPEWKKKTEMYLYVKGVDIIEAGWFRWGGEREYRYGDKVADWE